jgi:hypothetical protein
MLEGFEDAFSLKPYTKVGYRDAHVNARNRAWHGTCIRNF